MSFAITASVVVAVGTTAYNSRQARKAQEKQERSNLIRRMAIEGQAPELLDIGQGIADQPIMGSDISQALQSLRYDPNAGFMQMLETQQMPAEQEIPPEVLEQLMMEQQAQYADGGPVGRGEDTYFFTIEDIEGMMAEPDPMMQNVGAGLMAQMGPGMGAVPATPGQIQMMAEGGLIGNQHKIDKNNNGRIDAQDFEILRRQEGGATDVKKSDTTLAEDMERAVAGSLGIAEEDLAWASSLSEKLYPGEELDGRGDAARHLALGALIAESEYPDLAGGLATLREYLPYPDSGRAMDIHNNELGMSALSGSKQDMEEQIIELIENGDAKFMSPERSRKMRGY